MEKNMETTIVRRDDRAPTTSSMKAFRSCCAPCCMWKTPGSDVHVYFCQMYPPNHSHIARQAREELVFHSLSSNTARTIAT